MRLIRTLALASVFGAGVLDAQAANVLVVLSDSAHLDLKGGKTFATGFYLNELMQPVKALTEAGHEIVFATPKGTAPALDKSSVDKMYFGGDEAALQESLALLDKLRLTSSRASPVISLARVEEIGYDQFDAVYVPGGHAPMQDLLVSPELGKLLAAFHAKGKTTALVCHGPIALLSTLPDAKGFTTELETSGSAKSRDWIYAGYKLTVISNQEEEIAKGLLNGGAMKFYPQTALETAGARFTGNESPWAAHVVTDRELITGQNPASAPAVAAEMLKRLK
ncbi:thiazole biosynthesis protein ThiJ [Brucella endophytica]|uniref:Thiazole biosynthesis protein ThiJ n=1 Tax=Brucella endophytica TaxID=1963359 RepID=A0A916S4Q2_9HYPH|nr:type 1 glutamine amidotransferase domain-containing protein [Brucella endophytica]GGA83388.1 thiazole biosynthesis protein ThiJ [Brucella endophytica]